MRIFKNAILFLAMLFIVLPATATMVQPATSTNDRSAVASTYPVDDGLCSSVGINDHHEVNTSTYTYVSDRCVDCNHSSGQTINESGGLISTIDNVGVGSGVNNGAGRILGSDWKNLSKNTANYDEYLLHRLKTVNRDSSGGALLTSSG